MVVFAGLNEHPSRRLSTMLRELSGLIATHLDQLDDIIPGLRLFVTHQVGEPTMPIAEASSAFITLGAKQVAVGDQVLGYGPGDYFIVSLDLPVTGRFTTASRAEPFLGIGLSLGPVTHPTRPGLATSAAPDDLLDALIRLLRVLDQPHARAVPRHSYSARSSSGCPGWTSLVVRRRCQ